MDIDYTEVLETITKAIPDIINFSLFLSLIVIIYKDFHSTNSLIKKGFNIMKDNILIGLLTFYVIYLLVLKLEFSTSDWANLSGSFIGILGAYSVANYQLTEEKKENKTLRKPIIYISNKTTSDICFDLHSYQVACDNELSWVLFRDHVYDRNFNVGLKLVNASMMNIYELSYEWEIEIEQLKREVLKEQLIRSTSEKNRYNFNDNDSSHINKSNNSHEVFYVTEIGKNTNTEIVGNGTLSLSGNSKIDKNYLESNENVNINLPSDFLRLIENNIIETYKFKRPSSFDYPTLSLRINFSNYELRKHFILFKITVISSQQITNHLKSGEKILTYKITFEATKELSEQIKKNSTD